MGSEVLVKKMGKEITLNFIVGGILLAAGLFMMGLDIQLISNNKAIIALSFIPLGIALGKAIQLFVLRKYPKEMNSTVVSETDERLIKDRNEAEATANRVMRWLLNLLFVGYTLMAPAEVFVSVAWWMLLFLNVISLLLTAVLHERLSE